MGGVWGRVLASRDQIDTSLRSLYIAGTINRLRSKEDEKLIIFFKWPKAG